MDGTASLAAFLKSLGPSPLCFKPNPGNGGDALIAHATRLFFDREGIDHRLCRGDEDLAGQVVVHGGGGNFVELYPDCSNFVARYHASAARLVILPHTIRGHEDLLSELGSNVTIYCRELTSFEHVVKHARSADVRLADDMALMLDPADLLGRAHPTEGHDRLPAGFRRRVRRWRLRCLARSLRHSLDRLVSRDRFEQGVVHCMREDEEQTDHPRAADNIDLSKEIPFELEMLSGAAAEQTSRLFFEFLEEWDVVHTNRLHVAIAAGLLDKRVHLYANANPKNESMYRDVLSDRFPKLSWEG